MAKKGSDKTEGLLTQLSRIKEISRQMLLRHFIIMHLLPYLQDLNLQDLGGCVSVGGSLGEGRISVTPRGAFLLVAPWITEGFLNSGQRFYYCFFDESREILPDSWAVGGITLRQRMNGAKIDEVFRRVVTVLEGQFS